MTVSGAEHGQAVVLIVEGLSPALVGCYGANLARTPALDRLSVHGVVLDQCFVDATTLQQQLLSLWTGQHALQRQRTNTSESPALPTIWELTAARQLPHCLLTDCHVVAESAEQAGCQEVVLVDAPSSPEPVTETSAASAMALFAAAADVLKNRQGLVWIHSRGLRLPWDVPLALREHFADPEDPAPPAEVGPPDLDITRDTDPDLIVGWGQVATAQASLLDEGLAALTTVVQSRTDATDWSWMVSSLGGMPLGEHGRLGWGTPRLFGEEVQTVTVVQPSTAWYTRHTAVPVGVASRRAELFQLPDLCMTVHSLLDLRQVATPEPAPTDPAARSLWGQSIFGQAAQEAASSDPHSWPPALQLAVIRDLRAEQRWIRCPAWSAWWSNATPRLFVKPEDRWEVNDVADRRPDLCEQLDGLEKQFVHAAQQGERGSWLALDKELTSLLR